MILTEDSNGEDVRGEYVNLLWSLFLNKLQITVFKLFSLESFNY